MQPLKLMSIALARQNFINEVNQPESQINLAKAALYIAAEEYPDLDIEEYLNALATMAAEIQERLPTPRYPLKVIQSINEYLYKDLGFQGNTENYYDPRNSFLNEVIDRRVGIPITLSLVYLEIAKRLDFPMVGIGMPGHFLIRPEFEEAGIFVDAFHQGEVLFPEDCQERLQTIYGQPVPLLPQFLEPIRPVLFLMRMLTNLKIIYLNQQDANRALAVIERLLILYPEVASEWRDRGLIQYQLGSWDLAQENLQTYLNLAPMAEDATVIEQLLIQLKNRPENLQN